MLELQTLYNLDATKIVGVLSLVTAFAGVGARCIQAIITIQLIMAMVKSSQKRRSSLAAALFSFKNWRDKHGSNIRG